MTDFVQTYMKIKNSLVTISADDGVTTSSSSGFITNVNNKNYIITTAHSVMKDISLWGIESVLFSDDGAENCDTYIEQKDLSIPAGTKKIIFRFIPDSYQSRVYINNVKIKTDDKEIYSNSFSQELDGKWTKDQGIDWKLESFKGKFLSKALTISDFENSDDTIGTINLNLDIKEDSYISLSYKISCDRGLLIVGYCSDECNSRVVDKLYGTYNGEVHSLKVIGLDGRGDIAICLPDDGTLLDKLKYIPINTNSRAIPIASPIAVVGNPLSLDPSSISTGVVRDNKFNSQSSEIVESILTSAPSFPGNSGCPYVLNNCTVGGLLAWGMSDNDSTLNGGPSASILNHVLRDLVCRNYSHGYNEYQKAYTGLNLYGVDANIISQLGLPMYGKNPTYKPGGYVVLSLGDDSPFKNVLNQLDVIMSIYESGKYYTVKSLGSFQGQSSMSELTWFIKPTSKVNVKILRFDQNTSSWNLKEIKNVQLTNFPLNKDIPYGNTLKNSDLREPIINITRNKKNGEKIQKKYKVSKYI